MSGSSQRPKFFIGWDVGGWNCDNNQKSRDAIVILNAKLALLGQPWRGNLRAYINEATTTVEWIRTLFFLCETEFPDDAGQATLAIDTPLGFSEPFVRLVTASEWAGQSGQSQANPYLFRQTEQYLFQQGLTPLSAIKDMIGSQATKGMHVLAKFAPTLASCGVWTDGTSLTAIEAYPSACKGSATIQSLRRPYPPLSHADTEDALTCALLAYLFTEQRELLASPDQSIPSSEGWIWVPKDTVDRQPKSTLELSP
jgi:hypothetical protein